MDQSAKKRTRKKGGGKEPERPPIDRGKGAWTAGDALTLYLSLGPSRKLSHLYDAMVAKKSRDVPSYGQLRQWSSRYKWRDEAARFDAEVDQKARALSQDTIVEVVTASREDLLKLYATTLARARQLAPVAGVTDKGVVQLRELVESLKIMAELLPLHSIMVGDTDEPPQEGDKNEGVDWGSLAEILKATGDGTVVPLQQGGGAGQ